MRRALWPALVVGLGGLLFGGVAAVAAATDGSSDDAHAAHVPAVTSADAGFARDMAVHHQQAVEMSFIVRDRTQDDAVRRLAYDIANTQANQRGMLLGWLDLWGLPKVYPGAAPMAWMASGSAGHGDAGHTGHAGHDGGSAGQSGHSGHDMSSMPGMAGMDGTKGTAGTAGAAAKDDGRLMPGMATNAELDQLRKASGKQAEVLFLQLMTDHHKGGVAMARGCAELCSTEVERNLAQGMVEAQQSELTLMADMLKQRGAAPRG
ncbi:DUF305 domain-containing protein [Streptomyces sp. NPDC093225]|uniref:DUF305 domain-containing protein n=1 Tax=Streptomyces sp. NPDC093225 TaxID=3366034 RepID=UPI0038222CD4